MCGGWRVGTTGAVGRAPTGAPRLRCLEPSSPSILISSDLPLPCFTPLPTVLIWPEARRTAGAATARFHLQLSDGLPACLSVWQQTWQRDASVFCKEFPIHPAVTHVCLYMQSNMLLVLILHYVLPTLSAVFCMNGMDYDDNVFQKV